MAPPINRSSANRRNFRITPIFSLTLIPPNTTTNGRLGLLKRESRTPSSFSIRNPATAGRYSATPAVVCLLYTSDAADDLLCVDLGGRRIIKKKNITDIKQ